jgi:hypothetical protein
VEKCEISFEVGAFTLRSSKKVASWRCGPGFRGLWSVGE